MLEDWTLARWLQRLGGRHPNSGWLYALGAPDAVPDARAALSEALTTVESALAEPLAALTASAARRLVVVPHGVLHLIPWAALPSLAGVAVSTAPSVRILMQARRGSTLAGRSLTVVNPTGDLALAELEARSVARLPNPTETLTGLETTAERIRSSLSGCRLFHFMATAVPN